MRGRAEDPSQVFAAEQMKHEGPFFSIVTVCLNPGSELIKTADSVLSQDFKDYEYVIKDGGSDDGTERYMSGDSHVRFVSSPDEGIYHAMNQALAMCGGKYVNFMNAGDTFAVNNALRNVAECCIRNSWPDFLYVDRYNERFKAITYYPSKLSLWYLFRKPVCHQTLFVRRNLLEQLGGFDTNFRILADYDVLLKLALEEKGRHSHCPIVGVNYKDDGVSSNPGNRHGKLTELYRLRKSHFTLKQRLFFGLLWRCTLPAIRIRMARQDKIRLLRKLFVH